MKVLTLIGYGVAFVGAAVVMSLYALILCVYFGGL